MTSDRQANDVRLALDHPLDVGGDSAGGLSDVVEAERLDPGIVEIAYGAA
ncbi:MAG: hypothetical protein WKF47_01040 [Geodermatophilaceae bacterium]